jgi:phosphatidylserine decarboxylase
MTPLILFRAIAPEFASLTDLEVNVYIGMAVARVSLSRVLDVPLYNQIVAFLAAHLATLAGGFDPGAASPVTGRRAGQEAVNYAQIAQIDGFQLTRYGREYENLVRTLAVTKPRTTSALFRM